jgi:DNA-binding SARP family transcriptional activator
MGIDLEPADCTATHATVHLLGSPYVSYEGNRIQVPEGSKRLLAFVALHRDGVERRYVAGSLWPIGGDDRAAGNLRSALWRLRGAGIDIVECDKWTLRLGDDVAVDVYASMAWAERVINDRTNDPDLRVSTQNVNALDLLPGWYDDWTIVERERLRQRMLHAFEALSSRLASIGRYSDAIEAAITAINAEPLRESAHRVLIEVHLAECNWIEAHRTFVVYRDLVRRELGIEPSHELSTLLFAKVHRPTRETDRGYFPSPGKAPIQRIRKAPFESDQLRPVEPSIRDPAALAAQR